MTKNAWLGLLTLIGFYIFVQIIGVSFLLPARGSDADAIEALAQLQTVQSPLSSYAIMAAIFSTTNELMRLALVISLFLLYSLFVIKNISTKKMIAAAIILLMPAIVFYLSQFIKDTLLVPFILVSAWALQNKSFSRRRSVFIVALAYTIYGVIFRDYYFVIFASFLIIILLRRLPVMLLPAAVSIFLVTFSLVPGDILQILQGSRDKINSLRVYYNATGSRTAFINPFEVTDFFGFWGNYIFAIIRLNFPIFFSRGIPDIFLQLNVVLIAATIWTGFNSMDSRVRLSTYLAFAHLLVLPLFEPDLGSYLRHASCILPFLVPALLEWDTSLANALAIKTRRKLSRSGADRPLELTY